MTTERVLQADRSLHAKSGGANARGEDVLSTCPATSRPEVRVLCVYLDVGDAPHRAERIADAELLLLPGSDQVFRLGDHGWTGHAACQDEASRGDTSRFLTTVVVTDIIDSTRTVARLGDRRWRELLAEHYAECRARVDNGGGELVDTTGDGIIAIFDAPTRAIRAAIAIQSVARESGMRVRAGVHTGECERLAGGVAGLAVHIAARICALGGGHEVIATRTVRDLATGSMLAFEPRGCHQLKGVPGNWTVFTASDAADDTTEREATDPGDVRMHEPPPARTVGGGVWDSRRTRGRRRQMPPRVRGL